MNLAAVTAETSTALLEIGLVAVALAGLARLAGRFGLTAIPLYLLAGLAVGEGGLFPLDVSEDFIALVAEIGVLLLLLTLGLEYSASELRRGVAEGAPVGALDFFANFTPGFAVGLVLGWATPAAVLLGGVSWVSSSGIAAKVMRDLDRLANRETPAVINILVIEDLAMAVFLPVAAALVTGRGIDATIVAVLVALTVIATSLVIAVRFGTQLSNMLDRGGDESLLLALFGLTLVVGGLAQRVGVSAAIGAFLLGLALSGPVQHRAGTIIGPLRDLFAAVFFVFFSFQIDPADLLRAIGPAAVLAAVGIAAKLVTGWFAAARMDVARPGRIRAGTTLAARGEFSIVIASLGAALAEGTELGAVAAGFVLLTAIVGPLATRFADRSAVPLSGTSTRSR